MSKFAILLCLCAAIAAVECGLLKNLLHHGTSATTEVPTTTPRVSLIVSNNVPNIENGCRAVFKCTKKLKNAAAPKPCTKYCLNKIECNGKKDIRSGTECVLLNEALVESEYLANLDKEEANIQEIAMIDFPCQPGYLPDSRGRCREIW